MRRSPHGRRVVRLRRSDHQTEGACFVERSFTCTFCHRHRCDGAGRGRRPGALGRAGPLRAARTVSVVPRPARIGPLGRSRQRSRRSRRATCRGVACDRRVVRRASSRSIGSRRLGAATPWTAAEGDEQMRRDSEEDRGVIVVGVDSSDGAAQALRFALEEAKLRGATLRVVHAWQFGYIGLAGLAGFSPAGARSTISSKWRSRRSTAPCRRSHPIRMAFSSSAGWSRALPRRCWSTSRAKPICWSSGRAGTAVLPACYSDRSVSNAPITRPVRS